MCVKDHSSDAGIGIILDHAGWCWGLNSQGRLYRWMVVEINKWKYRLWWSGHWHYWFSSLLPSSSCCGFRGDKVKLLLSTCVCALGQLLKNFSPSMNVPVTQIFHSVLFFLSLINHLSCHSFLEHPLTTKWSRHFIKVILCQGRQNLNKKKTGFNWEKGVGASKAERPGALQPTPNSQGQERKKRTKVGTRARSQPGRDQRKGNRKER